MAVPRAPDRLTDFLRNPAAINWLVDSFERQESRVPDSEVPGSRTTTSASTAQPGVVACSNSDPQDDDTDRIRDLRIHTEALNAVNVCQEHMLM